MGWRGTKGEGAAIAPTEESGRSDTPVRPGPANLQARVTTLQEQLVFAERRIASLEQRLSDREELYRLGHATEHVGDSVEFTTTDGDLIYVNPAYVQLTGYSREDVLGRTPSEVMRSGAHTPEFYEEIWNTTASGKVWKGLMTSRRKDGTLFTADCTLSPIKGDEGELVAFMCLRRDVTAELEERAELRQSLHRYALAAAGANDGMWGWDLATDELLLSARWRGMLGYPPQELRTVPADWFDRIHPSERVSLKVRIQAHIDGETDTLEAEYRIRHADGGWRWMLCRGLVERSQSGEPLLLAGSQADITRQKSAELRLRHEALHDALTGLPNRVLFEDRLQQALARVRRNPGRQVCVLFVDLDRFKNINDSFGHAAGDRLLQEIGRRLRRAVRTTDTVARIGGDEFTVLLDGVRDMEEVRLIAGRIQESVRIPVLVAGQELVVSSSLGVAMSDGTASDTTTLLRDADTAMYRAKAEGRDCMVRFESSMREAVVGLVEAETQLRRGIRNGELLLHYQPIVHIPSRKIIGFEALVRWERPGHGVVLPGEFLHIAREAGLMDDLERWVLEAACVQIGRWRENGALPDGAHVAVNVSPERVTLGDLADAVADVLDRTGVPPSALRLEITESSLLGDELATAMVLEQLRNLGVQICLDDFATGYSSLSYVHRYPVDVIKIDRSFTNGLPGDPGSEAIIRAILGMAEGLDIEVVAEGVETRAQLGRLEQLGCVSAQGYFLGYPGLPEKVAGKP